MPEDYFNAYIRRLIKVWEVVLAQAALDLLEPVELVALAELLKQQALPLA